MNRTIKFRGKRKDSGEWEYGCLVVHDNSCYMFLDGIKNPRHQYPAFFEFHEVIPETVGQFTGLIAENCKKNLNPEIYADDIFRSTKETDSGDITTYDVVMWIDRLGAFYLVPIEHYEVMRDNDVSNEKEFSWLFEDASLREFSIDIGLTKVGSIQDNPELL